MQYIQYGDFGEVLCVGSAPDSADLSSMGNTITVGSIVGVGAETHYVQNGELIPFPAKPSPHHEWDWTTKSWLPNLDAARESQRQAWNVWRDRELVAGYVHEGHRFHTNDGFIGELHLILKGYEEGLITGTSSVRTMTNEVLQKTGAEIKTLLLILGLHRQAIYQQSWAGKDALAGLTTLEDIVAGGPPA